uniref:Hexosyltransferase n=1 Tax=Panagrellus redivivus TaxID=6233 RepID=A0A7E4W5P6_PANRE
MKHRNEKFTLLSAITTLFCLSAATVKVVVKKRATRMAPMTYLKLIVITFIAGWAYWLYFKESDTDINDAYFDEDSKFIRVNAIQTFVNTVPVDANPNDFDTYQLNFSNYRLGYHMNRPMNRSFCDKASVLVMILTRPDAFNTRAAVRESWLFNV